MKTILIVSAAFVACALAAPTNIVRDATVGSSAAVSPQPISKQFQKINDDGSYTFGYESSDGSYRVENRDVNGFITGKYGYIDSDGKLHETEYVAGKQSGRSIGYQARGAHLPDVAEFPVIRAASAATSSQRALDLEYSSVDDDEDGIPDVAPAISTRITVVPQQQQVSAVNIIPIRQEVVAQTTATQNVGVLSNDQEKQVVVVPEEKTVAVPQKQETHIVVEQQKTPVIIEEVKQVQVPKTEVIVTEKKTSSAGPLEQFIFGLQVNRGVAYSASSSSATPAVGVQHSVQQVASSNADAVNVDTLAGFTRII